MVLLGLYLWFAAIIPILPSPPLYLSHLTWILRNSISPAAGIVTLVYWFILFPTLGTTSVLDVHCHLVNSLIVIVDVGLSRLPYYFSHFFHSIAYLLIYLIFSLIYWGIGATDPWGDHYIYPPLDYGDHPLTASLLIIILVVIIFPLLQLGLWRWWWYCERRWGGSSGGSSPSLRNPLIELEVEKV